MVVQVGHLDIGFHVVSLSAFICPKESSEFLLDLLSPSCHWERGVRCMSHIRADSPVGKEKVPGSSKEHLRTAPLVVSLWRLPS